MTKMGASFMPLVALLVALIVIMSQITASEGQLGNRLSEGFSVKPDEFPFLARVEASGAGFCTGSVIDKRHILTAAHCLKGLPEASEIVAKLGCRNRDDCMEYEIEAHESHPRFYDRHHDIAILRTREEIAFTGPIGRGAVDSIKLAANIECDYEVGDLLTVVGWEVSDKNAPYTLLYVPKKIDFATISPAECENFNPKVSLSQVCTWSTTGDLCGGDMGAPLFRTNPAGGKSTQIGIWSSGGSESECGEGGSIRSGHIYTRVAAYSPWIKKAIKAFEQSSN